MATTLKNELWKPIAGYDGLYSVSSLGRVLSHGRLCNGRPNRKTKDRILSERFSYGYQRVLLSKDGIEKNLSVHRLVCEAFVPKVDGKKYVNHIDGVKSNNTVANLEWCTQSENCTHAFTSLGRKPRSGHFGEKNPMSKRISQYDLAGNFIKTWDCCKEVRRAGIKAWNISHVLAGRYSQSGGYKWKLAQ